MNDVRWVAGLIQERNRIDAALSACIRRPALPGHLGELRARGLKIGVASSVRAHLWEAAEIYPRHNPAFPLTAEQRELLALFSRQP